jgi:hypothetical protein
VNCIRCHQEHVLSERRRAILSRDVGCDIPPNMCFACIVADPAYRPAIMEWTYRKRDETIRRFQEMSQKFRNTIVRPLELIDQWVDSLRSDN